jgi:NAD(P)-dependent dehydrogenase (short-subunit alcohol dehydrogenase family)
VSSLEGKTALVTGGGRGIGKAIARRLAEAGARVAIASRKAQVLEAAAAEIAQTGARVAAIPCHAGRPAELERLVAETESRLGPIDILVNNAATNIGQGPALEVTDEAFLKTTEINVLAPLRLVRLVVPGMIARGRGGSIINIASIAGLRPQRGGLCYSFTKAGLLMMTRVWAMEFGRHNIRVNAICPGLIQTDFSEYFWKNPEYVAELERTQPLPRIGQPEEIAGMALYLAGGDSSFVTGQALTVDGGHTAV